MPNKLPFMTFGAAAVGTFAMWLLPLSAAAQQQDPTLVNPSPSHPVRQSTQVTPVKQRPVGQNAVRHHLPHSKSASSVGIQTMTLGATSSRSDGIIPQSRRCDSAAKERPNGQPGKVLVNVPKAAGDAIIPPYHEGFDTEEALSVFTIIDNNADGSTWSFDPGSAEDPNGSAKYSYSERQQGDDWLITPPIRLEKGNMYTVKFKLKTKNSWYTERVEVRYGNAASVEGMTHQLLPATDVVWDEFQSFSQDVLPEETGDYYFGFHAISPADQYAFFVDDIEVEAGKTLSVPDAVENLRAIAGEQGAQRVTVFFDTPKRTLDGGTLTGTVGAKVYRDGNLVEDLPHLEPGSPQSVADDSPSLGFNTYTVQTYTAEGEGRMSGEVKVFVGPDVPFQPQNAIAQDQVSSISLSWTDSEVGANGGYVDKATLTHKVYSMENAAENPTPVFMEEVPAGQENYVLNLRTDVGEQQLRDFAVSAVNEKGESGLAVMPSIIMGAPYELPFVESFSDGALDNDMWWTRGQGYSEFLMLTELSADDDNGCLAYDSYDADDYAVLGSGKITLAGAATPTLFFSHMASAESNARIVVSLQQPDGTEEVLKTIDASADNGQWVKESIAIDPKYSELPFLFLQFTVSSNTYEYVMLDAICVRDFCESDMAVKEISVPKAVRKGHKVQVEVAVQNRGVQDAAAYSVSLYADGELLGTVDDSHTLPSMAVATHSFDYTSSLLSPNDAVELKAVVQYAGDLRADNDTKTLSVQFATSDKPCPESVTVTANGDGTSVLRWAAPTPVSELVHESFEDYASWSQDQFGEWTARSEYRKDATGNVFASNPYPGEGEPFAFTLADPLQGWLTQEVLDSYPVLQAHDGDKYLASFYGYYEDEFVDADDWLISPVLSGAAQTVTFWVGNLQAPGANYTETFDVLYSKGGTQVNDFQPIGDSRQADTGGWKEVSVDLPAGAVRFAVRRKTLADEAMVFLLDDVTYEGSGAQATGYNIYRDGVLLTSVESGTLSYTDQPQTTATKHVYAVSAVYPDDESQPIAATETVPDGVECVETAFPSGPYTVYTLDGKRVATDLKSLKGLRKGTYIINDRKVVLP